MLLRHVACKQACCSGSLPDVKSAELFVTCVKSIYLRSALLVNKASVVLLPNGQYNVLDDLVVKGSTVSSTAAQG
jgi:hypothetical protein